MKAMSTLFSLLSNYAQMLQRSKHLILTVFRLSKTKKDLKIDALNFLVSIAMTVREKYLMKVLYKLKNDDLRVNCDSEPLQLRTASQYSCERWLAGKSASCAQCMGAGRGVQRGALAPSWNLKVMTSYIVCKQNAMEIVLAAQELARFRLKLGIKTEKRTKIAYFAFDEQKFDDLCQH